MNERAEIWRPIIGYCRYEISSLGRVKSLPRERLSSSGGRYTTREIVLREAVNRYGYRVVSLRRDDGCQITKTVHRLVASAFVENPYLHAEVNHFDGDKTNNRAVNLEWVSRQQNEIHKAIVLRASSGEKNHISKLTSGAVRAIRASSDSHVSLARRFGVSPSAVRCARSGRTWSHI